MNFKIDENLIKVLRWFCVLPAAVLGGIAARFVLASTLRRFGPGAWDVVGDSLIAYTLWVFLYHAPHPAAFVIAGTKTAPRYQISTAVILTAIAVGLSLLTHVVGQHLAGNRIGPTNYVHFCAESAGALGAAAYIYLAELRRRRASAVVAEESI